MHPPEHTDLGAAWMHAMRAGDFAAAWTVSDRVLQRTRAGGPWHHLPRHQQPVWDGTPVDGARVLVRCYHGLGDTIQFIRYAPLLRARAADVIVWAQPPLVPLIETMEGIGRVLPLHDGDAGVDVDVDVEVMELPYIFRTSPADIPARVPYFRMARCELPKARGRAIGVTWRGGGWSPDRSIAFSLVERLLRVPADWYVLQGHPGLEDCPPGLGIVPQPNDIPGLARIIPALDLVITVDSMAAHLAGALGAPVWTLLPAEADWRWMQRRDDSPWYPTMRLFRQRRSGDWEDVIDRVIAALQT